MQVDGRVVCCINCAYSIPIGGEAVACYHTRHRVGVSSNVCNQFTKFGNMKQTWDLVRKVDKEGKRSVKYIHARFKKDVQREGAHA